MDDRGGASERNEAAEQAGRASRRQVLAGMGLLAGAGAAGVLGVSGASAAGATTIPARPMPSGVDETGAPGSTPAHRGGGAGTNVFPTDTPGLTYRTIGVYEFRPMNAAYGLSVAGFGAYTSSSDGFLSAPVTLPPGAVIKEIGARAYNNSGVSRNVGLELLDVAGSLALGLGAAVFSSTGASQTVTTTLTPHTVTTSEAFHVYCFTPASGTVAVSGARVGYLDPAPGFHPLTPTRVYDSRWSPAPAGVTVGPLVIPGARTISVANGRDLGSGAVSVANIVPAGATAITYNLTAIATTAGGFLAIAPGGAGTYAASAVNWNTAGQVIANGGVVPVDSGRQVKVFAGAGGADFVIDVTGYYR